MKKIILTTVLSLCVAFAFAGCNGSGGTDMNKTRQTEPVKVEQEDTREVPDNDGCPDGDCPSESFAEGDSKDCPNGKCPKGDCPDNCKDDCPKKDCPDGKCPPKRGGKHSRIPHAHGRGHRKARTLPHRTHNN